VAETVALDVVGLGVLAHSHLFVSIRREEEITTGRQKLHRTGHGGGREGERERERERDQRERDQRERERGGE